ncbi:hypothetical protein [Scytonema sp. NUACC26]|uniref:hypothetical protein n=1 Tax=Scytonema sp. NUACC26 TaxID=3140176 RepID=UPI0034DC2080
MSNTSPSRKVANPKLTLYAFHLRNNLAQGLQEPVKNANFLWEQCQRVGQKLGIPRLESLMKRLQGSNGSIGVSLDLNNQLNDYLELLPPNEEGQRLLHFSAIPNGSLLHLKGEVYPLQIHDSYAIDITLRYPYPNVEIAQLSGLNPQGCLLPSEIQASLGQTLILFAQPVGKVKNHQEFADACITALLPQPEAEKLLLSEPASGKFLGSPIFEYDNGEDSIANSCHVLVWLNCDIETEKLEEKGDYYHPLINLLCCRVKIIYSYREARWCNHQARRLYTQLEAKVKDIKNLPDELEERLKTLKFVLTEIQQLSFEYSCYLRDLKLQRNTIEVNAKNYRLWLSKINDLSIKNQDNLEFCEQFLKRTEYNIKEQIRVDLGYLTPAKQLFEEMIATIRGIVEIEQAESDRVQQTAAEKRQERSELLISVVSTGLAVSGVSSQVASEPVKNIITKLAKDNPSNSSDSPLAVSLTYLSYYNFLDVLFHVAIGVIFALPVGAIVWCIQKRSKRHYRMGNKQG